MRSFWCLDLGWFGIRMIRNTDTVMVLTYCKQYQCIVIQDGGFLLGFEMVGLFGFAMPFKIRSIQHQNNFWPFKIQTCLLFEPPTVQFVKYFSSDPNSEPVWYLDHGPLSSTTFEAKIWMLGIFYLHLRSYLMTWILDCIVHYPGHQLLCM